MIVVLFSILPFVSTTLGGVIAVRLRHRLHPFMAFASGVLVAAALTELLPEAYDLVGAGSLTPIGLTAVAGYLVFTAIESFVHRQSWEHRHPDATAADDVHEHPEHPEHRTDPAHAGHQPPPSRFTLIGPVSLVFHSLLDGLAIGLSFRADVSVGVLVGLAVLAHDFADGMNVVTLALSWNHRERSVLALLALDAIAPVVGAALGTFVSIEPRALGLLLAAFSGVFLAIGAGHLLPEAQHRRPGDAPALALIAGLGAAVVVAVRSLAAA